jgi:hypothetical protein
MMRFFNYLNRFCQYLGRRPKRQRPERCVSRPTVEALEDRLVMDSAHQVGSTLFINASLAGFVTRRITVEVDAKDHTKLDVLDNITTPSLLLGQFTISSINTVKATVAGNDAIIFDDSNGFPLAFGTNVFLDGSGGINQLVLQGSQAINVQETYTAGFNNGLPQPGSLVLAGSLGVRFQFTSAIALVTDVVANPGLLTVNSVISQSQVFLSSKGGTEELDGLSNNDTGGTFTFGGKGSVVLGIETSNAAVNLNATAAAQGLKGLTVDLDGTNDTLNINATPSTVQTEAVLIGGNDRVNLHRNSGVVFIFGFGTSTNSVVLGSNEKDFGQSVTSGINNNVFVKGVGSLVIADGGNTTTKEQATVTESSIFGTGLFGNSAVVVQYAAAPPTIITGRLANTYIVAPSQAGARFTQEISIDDLIATSSLHVTVSVDSRSGLLLNLVNENPASGSLFISAPGGTFNPSKPVTPDGAETVTFPGGLSSQVLWEGFNSVGHS